MDYNTQVAVTKMSKMYNYFEGRTAIKLLSSMTESQKTIVLSEPSVQRTIFFIDDIDTLRTIFRKSPSACCYHFITPYLIGNSNKNMTLNQH